MKSYARHLLSGAVSVWLLATTSLAINITVFQPGVAFVPTPLPPPGPASDFEEIITLFNRLGRTTVWNSIKNITFEGDSGEPQGIVNLGEERYLLGRGAWTNRTVSYGNRTIINGTDRTTGAGYSHITVYDGEGKRVADATVTAPGDIEYHIGGLDYDGEVIWATVSQYRPNSTATIISIDPVTLAHTPVIRYQDHLGGVVHDVETQRLTTLNWGSRNASLWDLKNLTASASSPGFSIPEQVARNPSYYVDYQDCKFLGHSRRYDGRAVAICSGVTALAPNVTIGGLALVDCETAVPLAEVPVTLKSALGTAITMNPFDVALVDGRLRVYFCPDQRNSTLYIYEAEVDSPFQYGGTGPAQEYVGSSD